MSENRRQGDDTRVELCLTDCTVCPRECHADRAAGDYGYCQCDDGIQIASICAHHGEEPVISGRHGICNVFFAHCNMQCVYCQNHQISRNDTQRADYDWTLVEAVDRICTLLDSGCTAVGFVSPSHFVPQMTAVIEELQRMGRHPTVVFNSNAYDRKSMISSLEQTVDVWLPDLKYMDEALGREYSDAPDYPQLAMAAIQEMHRQKGSNLRLGEDGSVVSGLIIRHLVLPGEVENSKAVLRWIADNLSPAVHLSLMAQYSPTESVRSHPKLSRSLYPDEYDEVVSELHRLGFYRGWIQELSSVGHYSPDFDSPDHPFERD